jgi:hypothetical protein
MKGLPLEYFTYLREFHNDVGQQKELRILDPWNSPFILGLDPSPRESTSSTALEVPLQDQNVLYTHKEFDAKLPN